MFSLSFRVSGVGNNLYYLAMVLATSSHHLQANEDQERHFGKVAMDTKHSDVNDNNVKSSDIGNNKV